MNRIFASSLVVVSMFAAGCVGSAGDPTTSAAEEELTAKNTGLFVALSNEPSGGDFANITTIKRASSSKTKCADGSSAASCTAIGLDFSALNLSATKEAKLDAAFRAGHAVLQGKLQNTAASPSSHVSVPEIVVTAAWIGAGGNDLADTDKLYTVGHVIQNWMCLAAHPCPNINEATANLTTTKRIEEVDFDGVGASKTELDKAEKAMLIGGGGLLVGGVNEKQKLQGATVTNLAATDFYLPFN